jgi:hypothetical protein
LLLHFVLCLLNLPVFSHCPLFPVLIYHNCWWLQFPAVCASNFVNSFLLLYQWKLLPRKHADNEATHL